MATKRTYQPSKKRRAKRHGFLATNKKKKVISRRRSKGRARLAPTA